MLVALLGLGEFFFWSLLTLPRRERAPKQPHFYSHPAHQSEAAPDARSKTARGTLQHYSPGEQVCSQDPVQLGSVASAPAQHLTGAQGYENVAPLHHPTVDRTSASVTPPYDPSTTKPSTRLHCAVCDTTFGRKGDLDRHFRNKHVGGPRFYCRFPGCEFGTRGFDRRDKHDDHMRKGHKMVKVDGVWIWKEWATCVNGTWMVRE
jgi:hypothetical protein